MNSVSHFREIRRDGKVIPSGMTLDQLIEAGWPPEIICRIEWLQGKEEFSYENENGILSSLLPDKSGIVVLLNDSITKELNCLKVLNANRTIRFNIHVSDLSELKCKKFCWFEPTAKNPDSDFSVVVETEGGLKLLELNSKNAQIITIEETR